MKHSLSVLGLCIFLFSIQASADTETARKEFNAARALFEKGDYLAAAAGFRKAYEADPNWKLHYNIGQCEASAKNYGLALESFELYLAMGGDELNEKRISEMESEIDRLKRLVGFVFVNAPDGAAIVINDSARGTAPLPGALAVTAGVVQELRVRLNDEDLLKRSLKVSSGQTIEINVEASEQPAVPAPDAVPVTEQPAESEVPVNTMPQTETVKSPLVPTGIALLSVGGATLIAAGVTGGMALGLSKDLDESCPEGKCTEKDHAAVDKMNNLALTSTILYPAGGVLAVTGLVLLIVEKKKQKNTGEHTASFRPIATPGFTGLTVTGRF
jgi:hypothetical protein